MSSIDWEKVRQEFPAACEQVYLFAGAVSPLPKKVYESRLEHLKMMHFKGDVHWEKSVEKMEHTRTKLATLIDASPEDIGYGPNTSHNMNLISLILKHNKVGTIISCEDEFPSTLLPWSHHGYEIKRVAARDILSSVTSDTSAVVISHVQFATGYRQNLKELGEKLFELKIPFIVNATQSFGVFPISVKEFHISALTASCHKWMCTGYGVSVLYMSPDFRKKARWPLVGWLSVNDPGEMNNASSDWKSSTSAIETGVPPFNILAGLDAACDLVLEIGVENIAQRVFELSNLLAKGLNELKLNVISHRDNESSVLNSINSGTHLVEMENVTEMVSELEKRNILVSERDGKLRINTHYYNNESDIEKLLQALNSLLS